MRFFQVAAVSVCVLTGVLSANGATEPGRLTIPTASPKEATRTGLVELGRGNGLLYIPPSYHANEPLPLLILLHKAAGTCSEWFRAGPKNPHGSYAAHADQERFIILAPESPGMTWDSSAPKSFGYAYVAINHALEAAFARCAIDRNRVAIGGFSDGASYALSLGLANGDVISGIIAFSPGYIVRATGRGRPSLFISHGGNDGVLPIETTSRIFVTALRKNGCDVDFREFAGGHSIPPAVAEQAMAWWARKSRQR